MAQQTINLGTVANDGTGDDLRTGGDKINDNFTELYTALVGLLDFKGSTDCSANPNYPVASKGDYYLVSVAGKIGGASGVVVTAGDTFFATADNAGGTQAGVGSSWTVIEGNVAYAPVNKAGDTMTGDLIVPDEAYDATAWNGSLEVPTKNAVRDKIEAIVAGAASVSDAAYGVGWDGDTTNAPSKNAVYDKIETLAAGAATLPGIPKGRLTLVTLTPVLNSDQTAKTSVFYTPHNGKHVPIYDGAAWADKAFAEMTLSLDTSNHLSGNLYDLFIWNDAGTIKIGTGPAWSSGTSRGTGAATTEIELKDGIWTNKVSITLKNGAGAGTSGIAANTATLVGTVYCTANGQTEFKAWPAAASGGSAPRIALSNAYNRIPVTMRCQDSAGSYTYNSTTWRVANAAATGSGLNNRATWVDCLQMSSPRADFQNYLQAAAGSGAVIGLYLDATSGTPSVAAESSVSTNGAGGRNVSSSWGPQLGLHFVQAAEVAATAAANTFLPAAASPARQFFNLGVTIEY